MVAAALMIRPVAISKRLAQVLAISLVLGLLVVLGWRLTHQPVHPKFGQAAPSFDLPLLNADGRLSLSSLHGKVTLLNFWSSTCVPCAGEAAALQSLYEQQRAQGLVVVGIDPQDFKSDARGFIARHRVSYPNVNDVGASVADRYGVSGTPESFLVDRHGRVVEVLMGPIDGPENRERLAVALRAVL